MITISKIICFSSLSQILSIMQKQSSRNTNKWVSLVKICYYVRNRTIHYHINGSEKTYDESSQVLIEPQDKLKHKIETFQDYYTLSHLHSLLFVMFTLGAGFCPYCVDPLVSMDADRWSCMFADT